ncbi:MAG: Asp23/Gls24 family envelope stress response protein [Oscillospiraceae bacterium]
MIKVQTGRGEVTISSDVFTTITGLAATNCYGVKGMAHRSATDGLVHLLRRETMAKGVKVSYNDDNTVSIELHIIVDNGVNLLPVCRSIMSEVKYVVVNATGVEVRNVDVCVDSMVIYRLRPMRRVSKAEQRNNEMRNHH